jgi:lysophospholipase L1-like esterase
MDDRDRDVISQTTYEHRHGRRRFNLRQTVLTVVLVCVAGILLGGQSLHRTAESMDDGIERDIAVALTAPMASIADALVLERAADDATAWLSPDDALSGEGAFGRVASTGSGAGAPAVPPVTAEAFDPVELGAPVERRPLRQVLVTGDSMAMPLDTELARRFSGDGVRTDRDPHVGTGISKSALVDWGRLSTDQVKDARHDAVVVFIGANEGFPIEVDGGREATCCGADWAAAYATRVRLMMDTYRRGGAARVYWLTLPAPRDAEQAKIARVVNAAIAAAAGPLRAHVRVLDLEAVFTPGGRYRAAMPVGGDDAIVRESDGIHLNPHGSRIAADHVLRAIDADFTR